MWIKNGLDPGQGQQIWTSTDLKRGYKSLKKLFAQFAY